MPDRRKPSQRSPLGPAHEKVGQLLRDLRARRDITLRDMTSASPSYLSDLEHGYVTPTKRLLTNIVRELGGNLNVFLGLLPALQRERDAHKEQMKARRDGISPVELGVVYDQKVPLENPVIEVVDDETGVESTVEPEVTDPNNVNFRGPFIIEHIDEQHYVNADRILYKSIYNRTVRALEPDGFRVFPFSFGETPPDSILVSKIQIGVRAPAHIERVLQLGKLAYKVELGLPERLPPSELAEFSFFRIIDAVGYCDPFIGGSMAKDLKSAQLAIYFEVEPARVWWFENLTPYTLPGIYSPDHELKRKATGQYEKVFSNIAPAMLFGLAWDWEVGNSLL